MCLQYRHGDKVFNATDPADPEDPILKTINSMTDEEKAVTVKTLRKAYGLPEKDLEEGA